MFSTPRILGKTLNKHPICMHYAGFKHIFIAALALQTTIPGLNYIRLHVNSCPDFINMQIRMNIST